MMAVKAKYTEANRLAMVRTRTSPSTRHRKGVPASRMDKKTPSPVREMTATRKASAVRVNWALVSARLSWPSMWSNKNRARLVCSSRSYMPSVPVNGLP